MHERITGGDRAPQRNVLDLLAACGLHPLDGVELFAVEPARRQEERAAPNAYVARASLKQVA
ncbi:MAG TPA: hypothetical protein VKZ58_04835 [Longimicrobiales bacterium]|nr:hypothetical protein [Longimicrobiales bacterium]